MNTTERNVMCVSILLSFATFLTGLVGLVAVHYGHWARFQDAFFIGFLLGPMAMIQGFNSLNKLRETERNAFDSLRKNVGVQR